MGSELLLAFSSRSRSSLSMAHHHHQKHPSVSGRRTALTPPSVLPPSLSAIDNLATTKPVPIAAGSSRASSLLARVVSSPSSPTKTMPHSPTSPLPQPEDPRLSRNYSSSSMSEVKDNSSRPPMMRFATMPAYTQQNGGYVSFPDFDLICQEHQAFNGSSQHSHSTAVRT